MRHTAADDPRAPQAVAMYRDGKALRVIAKALGAGNRTVKAWLEAAGVPLRPTAADRRAAMGNVPVDPQEIVRLYREGMTISELRYRFIVSYEIVRAALDEAGVKRNRNVRRSRVTPGCEAQVRALFEAGYSSDTDAMLSLVSMGEANRIYWEMKGWHECANPECKAGTAGEFCEMCEAEQAKRELEAEAGLWPMAGTFRVRNEAYLEAGG